MFRIIKYSVKKHRASNEIMHNPSLYVLDGWCNLCLSHRKTLLDGPNSHQYSSQSYSKASQRVMTSVLLSTSETYSGATYYSSSMALPVYTRNPDIVTNIDLCIYYFCNSLVSFTVAKLCPKSMKK